LGWKSIATFVTELMMGAGGVIVPLSRWWPMLMKICKKYDMLLIVDEVMSGFGWNRENVCFK
jgi:putrescine aminotransferase